MTERENLRSELADAAMAWAAADAVVRAETKSFRALIGICEYYEPMEPSSDETGYPGSDGVQTCWVRREEGEHGLVLCGPCHTHGDRRSVRRAAMGRRDGAKRRMRNLAAKIEAAQ